MHKIYYVDFSDDELYMPRTVSIGYFSSVEKANEAAKKYADKYEKDYSEETLPNGTKRFYSKNGSVRVSEYELDVYLPDTW